MFLGSQDIMLISGSVKILKFAITSLASQELPLRTSRLPSATKNTTKLST